MYKVVVTVNNTYYALKKILGRLDIMLRVLTRNNKKGGHKTLLEVMDMSITLTGVVVSQVYVETHQIVR